MMFFARSSSELVYRQPRGNRLLAAGIAIVVLGLLLAMWPQMLALSLPSSALLTIGAVWLLMIGGCVWMALSLRAAFIFGVDGVAARGALSTRTLAYEHIAGCTVEREESPPGRAAAPRGWHLTFEAMHPGTAPLRLFILDKLPLDAAIIRRLKTVPGLSRRQLKMLEMASGNRVEAS